MWFILVKVTSHDTRLKCVMVYFEDVVKPCFSKSSQISVIIIQQQKVPFGCLARRVALYMLSYSWDVSDLYLVGNWFQNVLFYIEVRYSMIFSGRVFKAVSSSFWLVHFLIFHFCIWIIALENNMEAWFICLTQFGHGHSFSWGRNQ